MTLTTREELLFRVVRIDGCNLKDGKKHGTLAFDKSGNIKVFSTKGLIVPWLLLPVPLQLKPPSENGFFCYITNQWPHDPDAEPGEENKETDSRRKLDKQYGYSLSIDGTDCVLYPNGDSTLVPWFLSYKEFGDSVPNEGGAWYIQNFYKGTSGTGDAAGRTGMVIGSRGTSMYPGQKGDEGDVRLTRVEMPIDTWIITDFVESQNVRV